MPAAFQSAGWMRKPDRMSSELLASAFTAVESDAAFLVCVTAPATAGDRRTVKTQLKYTTYNTEFLFMQNLSTLDCPGADCKWTTTTAAQNHLMQVARIIKSLDSDIIQLTEVEDCTILNSLITQLASLGDATYKPYLVRGTDTATGQNVDLISRVDPSTSLARSTSAPSIPASGSKCPSASGYSSTKSVSKHFHITFNVPGFTKPITVIGAHLLTNPEDKVRCYEHEAQATVLASLANAAILNGNHAIISGDINDWSRTMLDRNSNKPISGVLSILTGSTMVQVAANAAQTSRYTQWYDKNCDCVYATTEVSSLDHILKPKSLSSSVSSVAFNNNLYTASCTGLNSDHYPTTVTIKAV